MSEIETKQVPTCSRLKLRTEDIAEEDETDNTEVTKLESSISTQDTEDLDGLPWHHAQLVQLYGKKVADDIIHPKQKPRNKVKVNSRLSRSEGKGAEQLWSMLRVESHRKLLDRDRQIPSSLKGSYGAFVRQLVLQKEEVPVKRNFYEKEDVPNMEHLLDRKKVLKVLDMRHKIELMGRSSKCNQDKTDILMYNNPLPDLVNSSGEEGIDRYLPSWIDEKDAESVASYKKWLGAHDKISPAGQISLQPSESILELVRPVSRDRGRSAGCPKVTFLTETEAGAERGQFSDQYKAQSELARNKVTNPQNQPGLDMEEPELRPFRGDDAQSARARSRHSSSGTKRTDPDWEPLTLNALMDYSDQKGVGGSGAFLNGSVKMHPLSQGSTAASYQ